MGFVIGSKNTLMQTTCYGKNRWSKSDAVIVTSRYFHPQNQWFRLYLAEISILLCQDGAMELILSKKQSIAHKMRGELTLSASFEKSWPPHVRSYTLSALIALRLALNRGRC